jgi:precorrin-6Y C5,15-methyltransferase (decarboxylating)
MPTQIHQNNDINKEPNIEWQGQNIAVISLGCGQLSALTPQAIEAIRMSEVIVGSEHHFNEITHIDTAAEKVTFPSPFSALAQLLTQLIEQKQGRRICILASGDALFFGVGSWLKRQFGNQHLSFYPNISSVQACFHVIGLPWQEAKIISLHGRPLSSLRRYLVNQQLIAILTDNLSNPIAIARALNEQGFGQSDIWVCESMGSENQTVSQYKAANLAAENLETSKLCFQPLNVCIVALQGQTTLPAFPGIADELFSTGSAPGYGMISKREVRLSILSLMQPSPNEVAWDIGAGCGSVSVEWARWNQSGFIYAIESSQTRIDHIKINADRFGTTQNLNIIEGKAPDCCADLPKPDSIFIGGSNGLAVMLDYAWQQLKPGGKLVASAVTGDSRAALIEFMSKKAGGEQVEIQVTKNRPDGHELRILAPVLLAKCVRPD